MNHTSCFCLAALAVCFAVQSPEAFGLTRHKNAASIDEYKRTGRELLERFRVLASLHFASTGQRHRAKVDIGCFFPLH